MAIPISAADIQAAVDALLKYGTVSEAARQLGLPRGTIRDRVYIGKRKGLYTQLEPAQYPGRIVVDYPNGKILVGSDAHYWPGPASTGHRAFVHFVRLLKPGIIIKNGDVMDMSKVSRHPPLGWSKLPEVRDEIEAAQERLGEIEEVAPKHARKLWPCGNHDSRFECRIASVAPELAGVAGASLQDHFPTWEPCWSVFVNDRPGGLVIKHRYKGGIHATWNNVIHAQRHIATGHLHSQMVRPHTSYNGTLYGVDTGCLADPWGEQFAYLEDSPRNWIAGLAVFEFKDGELLPPSLVTVIKPGVVSYHGELIEV
jgi:hypothetical protein